jgi:predicted ATPase/class 3 adenylate cyclase
MSDYRALLLTDVVDSTKLAERIGNEAMAQVWAAHDRAARDLLRESGGREIDKTDGMLLMFDHAVDAVDYALAYHRALATLPVPLSARAGLHVGPVILRENSAADVALGAKPLEVEGLAKPTAARVMAIARGGQLLMTEPAREALGKTKLRVVSHGHWLMKGLGEPLELFEAGDYESAFVPPVDGDKARRVVLSGDRWLAIDELPNNLPQQATSFIGRERELREVKELLGKTRLLTLLGMGGLGKTRLSLQAAAELRHLFPDGTWFVDLAPLRDESLVVSEAAQVLGVREESDRPLLQTLCAFLRTRQVLLILDNCEHLIAASSQLANAILRAAPNVRIVASSREPLHVPGEQAYPVLPLPVPVQGERFEALAQSTAVRLFVERARLQKPSFEFTEREAPAIAELVARLEGIPLALELAAARVRSLSVADINARLKDRYKLLTGGGKVLLERQQTLRALVDWSYDLLDEQEQTLLRRFAVFAGGFDLAAAEQVCGAEPLTSDDVLDLLGSLVEKSLVMLDECEEATRYRMLETIRDYAREKLDAAGERNDIGKRHCEHYFTLAKAARDGLRGPEQSLWVGRLEVELDNVRGAMALALTGAVDPFIAVKLAVAMQGFWTLRGYLAEGRNYVRAAIELPAILASDLAKSWALYVGAVLAAAQSDHAAARYMLETCLELRRGLGNDVDIAATLSTLTIARLQSGDVEAAAQGEREALQIFERVGHRFGQAICLLHMAQINEFDGNDAVALDFADQCLAVAREIGHKEIEAESELVHGEIAWGRGDLGAAEGRLRRSLQVSLEAGDKRGSAKAEWWLGRVALARAKPLEARQHLLAAVRAFSEADMREELLGSLEDCSRLALALSRLVDAGYLACAAAALRRRLTLTRTRRDEAGWSEYLRELGERFSEAGFGLALQQEDTIEIRDAIRLAEEVCSGSC